MARGSSNIEAGGIKHTENQHYHQHLNSSGGQVLGWSRLTLILTAACLCSCIYAASLVFISAKPCVGSLHSCGDRIVCPGVDSITNSSSQLHKRALLPHETAKNQNPNVNPNPHANARGLSVGELKEVKKKEEEEGEEGLGGEGKREEIRVRPKKTSLKNIVFGIAASSKLWKSRKLYVKEWWQPSKHMRGFVWLEVPVKNETRNSSSSSSSSNDDHLLPPFRISANTSQFRYSRRNGNRAALRLARIVSETFRLGLKNVDWFVMGDDDTVFFTDNLVRMLSNYDPSQMYYIGSQSESHLQNTEFSYGMAYGGGGFAISYPLAKALSKMQDDCLHRYACSSSFSHEHYCKFFPDSSQSQSRSLNSSCSAENPSETEYPGRLLVWKRE